MTEKTFKELTKIASKYADYCDAEAVYFKYEGETGLSDRWSEQARKARAVIKRASNEQSLGKR